MRDRDIAILAFLVWLFWPSKPKGPCIYPSDFNGPIPPGCTYAPPEFTSETCLTDDEGHIIYDADGNPSCLSQVPSS